MRLMLKDANHVKDLANKELSKVDEGLAQERKERARDLAAPLPISTRGLATSCSRATRNAPNW